MPEDGPEPLTALEQFAQDLREEVRQRCAEDAPPDEQERAFTEYVLERLAEHNEADDCENLPARPFQAESRGNWPAAKLNAWGLSGDGATLDLFVTLYHTGEDVSSVGVPETRRYFKLLLGFLRRARNGFHTQVDQRHEVFEAARRIHEAGDSLATVRLFFLTNGVARAENVEEEPPAGLELRYVLWDLKKLSQLRVGHREVIELDFARDHGGALPCLEGIEDSREYRTHLAFMPGRVLARIYGEHGQRLLERNVRAFLQVTGKVNKGLQRTLREEPHRFLAYNNGLCCTAAEVRFEPRQDGQIGLAWVRDFQIVNGGQTTASIYHASKKERLDVSEVVVQVKVTVLKEPERLGEMVPLIARYANSQNKINAADLAANGVFHHRLEQLSRTVWAPPIGGLAFGTHWYYERARGSYLDDRARQGTPARRSEWEKQNPTRQKFTKTDLAKYEHAWRGLPDLVCLGAEKNFIKFAAKMEEEGEPEVNLDYYRHTVAKIILWRTAEKLFDTLQLEGYRANSVAYAVSWLCEKAQRRIDLNRIWSEQRLPPRLCEALKTVCREAWDHLNHQQGNVGEASKKRECWESFGSREIHLPTDWETDLAPFPFGAGHSPRQTTETEWERLRHRFLGDWRTIGELEALTGKQLPTRMRGDRVSYYAVMTWPQLKLAGFKQWETRRTLVEMLQILSAE